MLNHHKLFYPVIFTLIYLALSFYGIVHHEIWLDEAHSYTMARDNAAFSDLIHNTRQEGHPLLWYIVLWVLTHVSHEVFMMQCVHIFISSTGIFLMTRYAPFNKVKQVLFSFSYFFFYEYNIISRNYALCVLGVTVYCILICHAHRNYLLITFVLLLLANSHFIGLLIALPLATLNLILLSNDEREKNNFSLWAATIGLLSIGLLLGILQVLPQEDSMFSQLARPGYFSVERFRAFTTPFKAFYQFPDLWIEHSWNSNLFTANKTIGTLLALIFPLIVLKAFGYKPLSLFVVTTASLVISLFFYTELMHNYTVRHWGFIFMAFYVAVWLQDGIDQTPYEGFLKKHIPAFFTNENKWVTQGLIYSTLFVQTVSAIHAYCTDLKRNFSNAKEVACYLQQHHFENDFIVLSSFTSGAAVSAYLDKPLYYPEYHAYGSYGNWSIRNWQASREEILKQLHEVHDNNCAFLIMNNDFMHPHKKVTPNEIVYHDNSLQIRYIRCFDDGIILQEHFKLYEVTYYKQTAYNCLR